MTDNSSQEQWSAAEQSAFAAFQKSPLWTSKRYKDIAPQSFDQSNLHCRYRRLFAHLYRQMAIQQDWTTEQMEQGQIDAFLAWLRLHESEWTEDPGRSALTQGLQLDPGDIPEIRQRMQYPGLMFSLLEKYWPSLRLSGRPPLTHVPQFMEVSVVMAYNLGTPEERAFMAGIPILWADGMRLTEGLLLDLLQSQCANMTSCLERAGFENLYRNSTAATAPLASRRREVEDKPSEG